MTQQQDEILLQLKRDLEGEHELGTSENFYQRLKKQKGALWSFRFLIVMVVMAVLSGMVANELPLYAKYKGETLFPAFTSKVKYEFDDGTLLNVRYANWKRLELESVVWPLIPYSPNKTDKNNGYLNALYKSPLEGQEFINTDGETVGMPLRFWHWMGTSRKGEDVSAIMIHGTKTALWVGVLASSLATLIGIILGLSIGYFGDGLKINLLGWIFSILGLIPGAFYAFVVRRFTLLDASMEDSLAFWLHFILSLLILAAFSALFYFIGKGIAKLIRWNKTWKFPLDTAVIKIIEIKTAIPGVVLILALLAIFERPSMWNLVFIIGLIGWGGIARIARAEVLRIRSLEYIEAAKALGVSERKIVFKHILLNSLGPVLVVTAFSSASAILVEAGLSFLGMGAPNDVASWGSLISAGKENFSAWWLVVFPGLAIFAVVMVFNLIGEGVRDALDPKVSG